MFKRTRWMIVGYAAGIGTSAYAAVKARQAARRYTPPEIAHRAASRAVAGAERVRDAVAEGRAAMTEREAELRLAYDSEGPRANVRAAGNSNGSVGVDR
jgi:aspartate/methionine/tyrosine aminotransferase